MMTRTLDILERLIAFDTVSSRSNLELITWVADYLAARDIPFWRIDAPDGGKANLIARIGPDVPGGVLLSGHSDVVPVEGQVWRSDPWILTRDGDRLYGRGVADMKGFIALALALVDTPEVRGLTRPLLLALTYDEEVGCLGAPHLIGRLTDLVPRPSLAIVGEPTSMKVVSVHKGMRVFETVVTGREAHSSQRSQGVSAIAAAVEIMALIGALDAEARVITTPDGPFDPPGPTLSVGVVEGGTANNILAKTCRFIWDLRATSENEADSLEASIREHARRIDTGIKAQAPEGGVAMTRLASAPPLELDEGGIAEEFVRGLTGDNGIVGAAFVAEAGLYQRAGIPAVLCGPGSILQAHQPDEWIAIEQIEEGANFLRRLAERLSA